MGYDFEADKQYNFETSVSMILELNKTCFTPGEYINGTITLRPKEGDSPPFLQDPRATLYLTEYAYYTYMENEIDPRTNQSTFVSKVAEENIPLLSIPLDFSQFRDTNISSCPKLPFTCQIPLVIYPSCLFGAKTFVKHIYVWIFLALDQKKLALLLLKIHLILVNIIDYCKNLQCVIEKRQNINCFFHKGLLVLLLKYRKMLLNMMKKSLLKLILI